MQFTFFSASVIVVYELLYYTVNLDISRQKYISNVYIEKRKSYIMEFKNRSKSSWISFDFNKIFSDIIAPVNAFHKQFIAFNRKNKYHGCFLFHLPCSILRIEPFIVDDFISISTISYSIFLVENYYISIIRSCLLYTFIIFPE